VLADPGAVCAELARTVPARSPEPPVPFTSPPPPAPPAPGEPLRVGHVLAALADRLPRNAIVIEESPSSRPELLARLPARESGGALSPAMGGLGFAIPAATGMRLAQTERPVVAIVGDGSSLYAIQALWSAATYGSGVLLVILANGGYAIMDRLAEQHGGAPPWPSFEVDIVGLATAFGCPARRITEHGELIEVLDEVVPGLAGRTEPLLLEIAVAADATFAP
jgi:benzoylformate decarboxylase